MMLTTLLPKIEQRYAAAGTILGSLIPTLCLAADRLLADPAGAGPFGFSASSAAALTLIPILSGLGFYRLGRARARLLAVLRRRRRSEARLRHDACHDRLTGLANRFCLERDVEAMLAAGDGRPALLLIDLDRFKYVNDSLGHAAGDELLAAIAARLRAALTPGARVYRLGGDEFVVIVAGEPSPGKVEDICATIVALFAQPFALGSGRVSSGCSIGVSVREPSDRSVADLLKRADLALYEAKQMPGTAFRLFDATLAEAARQRAEIEQDLVRALATGEFYLEYQPIVAVENRAVCAFEALLRWAHPKHGTILPDRFLPAAERTGLLAALGDWVLRTACLEAARWPAPAGLAVNIAGARFKDRNFVRHVEACLAEAGLAPGRLTLEVTESIFAVDEAVIRDSLGALRRHGVRVALDGFGAASSSLSNLRTLPIDQLKIDRSLARAMTQDKRDADLVEIILKLGQAFGMATTVGGIESESQLDFIRARGASEAQGYLISAPVPAPAAGDLLARRQTRLSA